MEVSPRCAPALGGAWAGPLEPRELAVLALLSAGYSVEQLPEVLRATPAQVSVHLSAAVERLGATDWREAVVDARRRGLID